MVSKIGQVGFSCNIATGSEDGFLELAVDGKTPRGFPDKMPFRVEFPNKINHKNKVPDIIEVRRQAGLVGLHDVSISLYGRSVQEERA